VQLEGTLDAGRKELEAARMKLAESAPAAAEPAPAAPTAAADDDVTIVAGTDFDSIEEDAEHPAEGTTGA
jgi:hypothetical protein